MKIRRKIMAALLAAFAFVLVAFLWNDQRSRDLQISNSLTRVAGTVEKLIDSEIGADVQVMETALDSMTTDPDIQMLLKKGQRDKLSVMVKDIHERLKSKNQISHLYFHRLDRTNLYRAHEPTHFDDKIERGTLKEAELTGHSSHSVEQGPTGASVLRVVYPVNFKGQRVGYMELGKEFQDIVHKIETLVGLKALLIVDKSQIKREQWEKRNNKSKFTTNWDFLPNHAIMASTFQNIPSEIQSIRLDANQKTSYIQPSVVVNEGDAKYRVITVPYVTEAGKKVADLVLFYDSSETIARSRQTAMITYGIALVILVSLILFFQFYLKRVEMLIANQQATMIYSSKMASLGEMAAGVAHEINTPLTAIVLNAQMIQGKNDSAKEPSPEIAKRADAIIDIGNRISKIISGLKGFSRESNPEADTSAFSIKQFIDSTMDLCAEKMRNRGVNLTVDAVPEIEVHGQMIQYSQVLLNLLNNSFDAIHENEGAWIRVGAQKAGEFVELTVTDSGKGIPPEVAKKMFQPFFTTKDIGQGTGFGLSISKGLMESSGGKLIYDANCKNTRFVMQFPVQQRKGQAA